MDHYDGLCCLASSPEEIFESQRWIQYEQSDGTYLYVCIAAVFISDTIMFLRGGGYQNFLGF